MYKHYVILILIESVYDDTTNLKRFTNAYSIRVYMYICMYVSMCACTYVCIAILGYLYYGYY